MPRRLRLVQAGDPAVTCDRLLPAGACLAINRCFRNEGLSPRYNPEFTSLELYQAYVDMV